MKLEVDIAELLSVRNLFNLTFLQHMHTPNYAIGVLKGAKGNCIFIMLFATILSGS